MRRLAGATLVLLAVTGCSGGQAPAPLEPSPSTTQQPTAAPSKQASPAASPTPRVLGFTDAYAYPDGVRVEVVDISHGEIGGEEAELNGDLAQGGADYVVFTIEIHNKTTTPMATDVAETVRYGPRRKRAKTTIVENSGDASESGAIRPGGVLTVISRAYVIPPRHQDDVVLTLRLRDKSHPQPAVFAGSVA